MQPDLLTPEKQENPPEPSPVQEETPLQPLSTLEAAQSVSAPLNEPTNLKPSPIGEKKRSKFSIAAILLGICVFILLVGVAGLGYAAYVLRTELISTQQQLSVLQGEHANLQGDYTALKSDNEKQIADLTQTKADLEKVNADLITAQADLKKLQDQNKALTTKIDKASKFANVLYGWFTSKNPSDVFEINNLIKDTKDTQLTALWDTFTKSPSEDRFREIMVYLVAALRNGL